jgi:hypothetical protein
LVSPRSKTAPTVRPTLVFLHRRFILCYSEAWVPSAITVGGRLSESNHHRPAPVRRRLARLRRLLRVVRALHPLHALRRPSVLAADHPRRPSSGIRAHAREPPDLGFGRRRHQGSSAVIQGCARTTLPSTAARQHPSRAVVRN